VAHDVLVIGAGPAGIASAYFLEQAGISYKVVDKAHIIASTWARLYPSLRLNTSRFFSHLPGQKFPLHYGLFATGKQYHAYLRDYISKHDFNIRLGVTVDRVWQDGDYWRVKWHTENDSGEDVYRAIISASGRFNKPLLPRIEGMDVFNGQILHAQDYLDPAPFFDKRVMVVGNGPSGVDIASELGNTFACKPVYLSQRTGVVLRPRYPFGLPKHLWKIISEKLPDFIGDPLYNKITSIKYNDKQMQGIKTPSNEQESSAAGGTRGWELVEAVRDGRVKSVDGPIKFTKDSVIVENGERYAVDAVIMATGYGFSLYDYLDVDITAYDKYGWPLRLDELDEGGERQVKGYPGLYLVGVFYQGKGAMYNFNTEGAQAVNEIRARLNDVPPYQPKKTHNSMAKALSGD